MKTCDCRPPFSRARLGRAALYLAFILGSAFGGPLANAAEIKLHTQQEIIEELSKPSSLDMNNPLAVFEAVFMQLPDKVTVYPTESYYYFTFAHNHVIYAGNIRFDAHDQFDGKVHFAYYIQYELWRKAEDPMYKKLGAEDGVEVRQVDKLNYTITFKGKTVEFNLPDLSHVKPSGGVLQPGETYIGPVWDESGVQFFLVYNKPAQTFLYLLNDDPKMDVYDVSDFSPAVTVGKRTSFAFYKDKFADRKILIGAFIGNTQVNNYFDGPFDQLPDNFIEGDTLYNALLDILPEMKGKMDRYGSLPGGENRYAITSYMYYEDVTDLKSVVACATRRKEPADYYRCFNDENFERTNGPSGSSTRGGKNSRNGRRPR